MFSPRCIAQLGLGAAVVMLVLSLTVLARSGDGAWEPRLINVGLRAPEFALSDINGNSFSSKSLRGKTVVLFFGSTRGTQSSIYNPRVLKLADQYEADPRVQFVAINRPASGYGAENACEVRVQARALGRGFPTLVDSDNQIARLFGAVDKPTFYVIDADGIIRYRGPFDDNADEAKVTQPYCQLALAALLGEHHLSVATTEHPATRSR